MWHRRFPSSLTTSTLDLSCRIPIRTRYTRGTSYRRRDLPVSDDDPEPGLVRRSNRHRLAKILPLIVPALTFVLGIFAQQVLQDYLQRHDRISLTLLALLVATGLVGVLVGYQIWLHARDFASLDQAISVQSKQTAVTLQKLALSSGLFVDFVEDVAVGESYRRVA